ncbi:MAG TPA: DUF6526 family protein [Chitinophagaceae bacterium]|nr:DUF6526 family protein [Chitinophagaceae bacterium]
MAQQHYKNHAKYYPLHHFIFYPVVLAGIIASIVYYFKYPQLHSVWLALAAIFLLLGVLGFMLRQHYGLGNQDRIVRLEIRLRYYILTQQRFEPLEQKLTFGQIAALRFAPDEELPALLQRTLQEHLSPKAIKQSINNWQADEMRV